MQDFLSYSWPLLLNTKHIFVISLGGFSEEAEIPGIKYVLSPYKLNLVATPLFVKPGIPYSIKVRLGVGVLLDVIVFLKKNMGG